MSDPVSVGLLIVRVVVGVVLLAHGVKHLLAQQKTSRWFASIGFKAPRFQWFASTATELGVGLLLLAGLLTGLAAAGVIGITFVAFWTVHRMAGFFITSFMKEGVDVEGYEYVMTLGGIAAALAIAGAGAYSLDAVITINGTSLSDLLDGWVGVGLIAIGVVAAAVQMTIFWRPHSVR
jgi:putative oxidoreductase